MASKLDGKTTHKQKHTPVAQPGGSSVGTPVTDNCTPHYTTLHRRVDRRFEISVKVTRTGIFFSRTDWEYLSYNSTRWWKV